MPLPRDVLQTLKRQLLEEGRLELGFQDLTGRDARKIFAKLTSGRPAEPPRKCRRVDETLESEVVRNISSATSVRTINLVGNAKLGNEVTKYLRMLPESVRDLDLSSCGLSTEGVRNICEFMENNSTITRLIMWGNHIDDQGALYIWKMLMNNSTLEKLFCHNDSLDQIDPMTPTGKSIIVSSLEHNQTLRQLGVCSCTEPVDPFVSVSVRVSLEKAGRNSAIEELEIGEVGGDIFIDRWEKTLERCENLRSFGPCNNFVLARYHPRLEYWRSLNVHKARKVTRDENIEKFQSTVAKAAKMERIDVVYYLLRNNVEHISR